MHRHWLILLCLGLVACERRDDGGTTGENGRRASPRAQSNQNMRETSRSPELSGEPLTPAAKKRLSQALQLAFDQAHGDEVAVRKEIAAILDGMIKNYPARPNELVELGFQIQSDGFGEDEFRIYSSEVIRALTRLDPDKAWKFSKEMAGGDPFGLEPARAMFSQLVASRGFAGAVDYIREQARGGTPIEIASYLLPEKDLTPEMVTGALTALESGATGEDFEMHLHNLSQRLVVSDLNAFSQWLEQQPRDDRYARAYGEVAETLAGKGEIEEAAKWVKRIQDPEKRKSARQSVLSSVSASNLFSLDQMEPEEAKEILEAEE